MALLDLRHSPHNGEIRLLPESRTSSRVTPRLLIYHSIVGSAEGAYGYFLRSTSLESTFIVKLSGYIIQIMDTERRADANSQANSIAGSVETEDRGDPNVQPWTEAQVESMVWLAYQYHRIHGVPLRRAAAWDGTGIGYHSMWGAPSQWTPSRGKTCPGTIRIRQFDDVVMPILERVGEEEDEMTPEQMQELKQYTKDLIIDTRTYTKQLVFDSERRMNAKIDTLAALITSDTE